MSENFKNELVTELPDITKIHFKKIDKDYLKVILINLFLVFIILFLGLIALHQYAFSEDFLNYSTYIYFGFTSFFALCLLYTLLAFPKKKYALREKDISYKSGLLVLKTTTVPFSRIQHVETDEKPISRLFNLASLSVYTAGDSSDDLVIKGIKKQEALEIKEFISSKINE
ncbi:PH domain-containing protein [Polaribacter sp. MED152]|uniref:PH domain-containing protein n=1 Tax=Polaribacter sp. MED152 TaxID=313598 RepID=UPI000068CB03|nr:PH domain-containing protein [Polaribacter sp. MED152]EAQ41700.1 hypothetical protein MED152_03260 [Polaribacter sp. MED152]